MTGSSTIGVDARNDTFSIGETQDISANLLSNDVVTGATASAVGLKVVSVNVPGVGNVAVGTSFTVTTASGRTGTARVNADGTFTFDGGDNFTSLVSGQTDSFTLHYTIQGTQAPTAGTVVMIEAEKMHLDNYRTELNLSSSGLYVIKGDDHEWNYASTTFAGATGRYNLDFKVLDEKDGASTIRVLINGVNVTGDIVLNQGTSSDVWRTLSFANLDVKAGDRIEIQALAHSGEHARVDFLKFTATGQGGVPVTDTASVTVHINGEGQALGTLGGRVWLDSNGDNLEVNAAGGWESAVAGVTVQLLNTAGQVVATTLSNAGGEYAFNVAAGDYRVKFIAPGGFEFVTNDVGSNDGIDSDAGPGGVTVGTARVVAGQTTWEVDAGLRVPLAVDAVDDGFSVGEVQDISANILANDSPQNGSLSVVGLVANGTARTVGQSFTVTTEGGRTGTVTVNANGTFTFDGGNNFVGLNQGQTDRFELHYTAAATAQIEKKYNLLFVLDISNSTVGTGGVNAFNGAGVGDVNGDGIANTVLDAEIQGVLNVVAKLRAQGVNPANIDIGLVTFSGVAQGFATVNAATLGTFRLDAASLTAALTGIRSGGWTDYEAGLKEAEKWLGTQTGDGAENRVFFLSDGRPVINNVNGQDVLQTSANYGDEVGRIAGNFGAQIHAIGIGANSDLAYLNQLDNTGGAEKVLDVSNLAAALDRATPIVVTDQAKVMVTINGEGQVVVVDARDDTFSVAETQDVASNILSNDSPQDGSLSVVAVEANGGTKTVGQSFQVTTEGGRQGTVTVNRDGTFTFDGGNNFVGLNQGQTDRFELHYTAAATTQVDKKYNLLFVLDISGSTIGVGGGNNIFNGTGVGDVNGDGLANTVLDAEIQGVINVINKLKAQGVNPANIDVGLVTFSGVDGAVKVNAATLGTFTLNATNLITSLTGVRGGGWTNYEAGLKEAEAWLGTQRGDGAENRVFFLSDGRPVINNVNGQDVLQTSANYGDEVARIAGNFGAQIHAIGIGANSDLAYLNQLDNTGGAEKVLDVGTLAAALDRATPVLVTDQAKVIVTINGEGRPVSVDAVDDRITVLESEAAGDLETLVSGAGSVLANDTTEAGAYTGAVVSVNGVTGNVGQFINLAGGGRVKINADGTVDFDADGDFEALNQGQSAQVAVHYTISRTAPAVPDGKFTYDFWNHVPAHNTIHNIPTHPGEYRGTVGNLDVNALAHALTGDGDTYKIRYTGNFQVTTGGTYSFTVGGDDGVGVYINGHLVAVRDGIHPFETASGQIHLGAGAHSIELRYFENYGHEGLTLNYAGADTGGGHASIFGVLNSGPIHPTVVTDTASVIVTVQGEDEAPVVDAIDDAFSVGEVEDVAANILANDSPQNGSLSVVGLVANGAARTVGQSFQVTTEGGRQGTVKVNADGTFTFDGGNNFVDLINGQTDRFQLHYTAGATTQVEKKYNLLFVLDISNSTVGTGGVNAFNGAGVGDVNGDGIANTVLDAEIQGVLNVVAKLRAQGVNPANIDIGLVTFSGVAQGFATVNAATLGTFRLDAASLTAALTGIRSGGWTDYEAGLKEAEKWLGTQTGDGAENRVFFLSDGRPVINNVNGQDVLQTSANYGDEVARIAGNFGAQIHAIGIGANSDLAYLNQLDNTGGAEKVLDVGTLAAALDRATPVLVTDQATVTVVVNGEGQAVVVDAVDDTFSVAETQDVAANILANDSPQDGSLTVVAVEADGAAKTVGQSFQVTTEGGRQGTVKVNADGTFTFDGGNNFVDLINGQTDRFDLHYTAAATVQVEKKYNLLFVLDISNSTVGTGGVNAFNGAGVGDVNGDGIANTVLDAEIQGVLNVIAKLRAQGVNPANIDIGLVTFSGVAQGFATVNAATLGTFRLDAASLTAALTGIRSGGWTDYEAGLKEAEKWLGTQTGDGAENRVFFLSDGRPVINNVNGQDVLQTSANYGDEVGRIAGQFGAQIHAIGIGANSDLAYLNQLDNTGGAEKVLDVSTLAAALDRATPVLVTDQATVTVVVNGEGQANLLPQAVADMIQTDEDRAATPINVLANDTPGDGPATVVAVQGGQVGQPITLTTIEDGQVLTATATLAADGTLTLVPGAAFDLLDAGEGRMFTLSYTLRDANGDLSSATISLVVNGLNEAPVAQDDVASGGERIAGLTGNVLANDSDPNGDALSVLDAGGLAPGSLISVVATSSAGRVLAGNVTILANGTYAFAPTAGVAAMSLGETVVFAVDYTARDPFGGTDTATLRVTITGANEGPVASANVYRTDEATAVVGNVLTDDTGAGVDSDPNGDAITVTAVQGGTVGTAFAVTTAGGRQGSLLIEADGDLVFTPTAGFDSLFDGQTDTVAVTYTITDANGATDTADVTVTIDGIDATPTAADDAVTIGETAPGSVALLANDTGGDGPLTVVSVAGGPATSGTATTEGGRTIAWSVDAQGVLTAALVDGADSLFVGETDRVTLDYGIADLDGDQDTAQVVVTVQGAGTPPDPTRLISVVGEVDTTGVPPQAIAVVLDMSINAFRTQTTNATGDVNGDGFASTAIDTQLRLLSNYANDLVADGRGGQELALVPTGFDAARPVAVVTADEIVAARVAGTLAAFFSAKIGGVDETPVPGTTQFGDTIDLEAGLQAAHAYFDAEGAGGGKVLVLTTTDGFSAVLSGLTPAPTDRVFASDPTAAAAALEARGGDIDVVYIRAGANIDTAATTNPLRLIDSDDFVNRIISSSLVALDSLVAEPVETVLGTLVDFSLSVNGELVAGIDADDVTANAAGFDFGPVVLEVDAGDALIEIGFGFDTDGDTLADEFKLITQSLAGDSFEFEVSLEDLLA